MIIGEEDGIIMNYENGNLKVTYETFGSHFEREMQRIKAAKLLLRTTTEYSRLEKEIENKTSEKQ